jgi:hypothetical protein
MVLSIVPTGFERFTINRLLIAARLEDLPHIDISMGFATQFATRATRSNESSIKYLKILVPTRGIEPRTY